MSFLYSIVKFTTKHAKVHLPAALLGVLILKLMLDSILLCMKRPILTLPVLDSRPALAGNADSAVLPQASIGSETLGEKVDILEAKRAQIEAERRQLERERNQLTVLKEEIKADLVKLSEIQNSIQRKLDEHKTIRNNKIKHLIKIYTTMAPKKAVVLIEKLDMDLVMELFSHMKAEHVGQLLPHMSAEKAAKIGEHLARQD